MKTWHGAILGLLAWLTWLFWSIHQKKLGLETPMNWEHILSLVLLVFLGALIGYAIELKRNLEAAYEENRLLLLFRDEFLPANVIHHSVELALMMNAGRCADAFQQVIRFQKGGLKAVGERDEDCSEQRYEYLRSQLGKNFRFAHDCFYRLYDLADQFKETFGMMRERDYTAYLPPPPPGN
ncbi:MAG: hypothetical protein WAX80_03355 [Minisyncoccia bacterium]